MKKVLPMKNCADYEPLVFEGTLTDHFTLMRNPGTWGHKWSFKLLQIITRLVYVYSPREDRGWLVLCHMYQQMNFPIHCIELVHPRTTPTSSGQAFVP